MGLIALLLASLVTPAWSVQLAVTGGIVRGTELPDGSRIFYGIPYAAPPTGDFRWKTPQPVVSWSGVRDATRSPNPCIQHDEGWNSKDAVSGREDCLYLSVHAPKHPPSARLPVIFWIHGGSNRAGSGYGYADSPIYRRGVVLVAAEYRLGVFGFLSLPELTAESPYHTSGNYAILDLTAALEWVKHDIAAFGGDPDNVTIAGQSAGAFNVGMLLLSPPARGLFHKAIMESGTPGLALPPRSLAENEGIGVQLENVMHQPRGSDGLVALRGEPAAALIASGDQLTPPRGLNPDLLWAQAIVDGWVLPRPPLEVFVAAQQAHVPLIIGNNTREFSLGGGPDAARALINGVFGTRASDLLAAYGLTKGDAPADDPVLGDVGTQLLTDIIFRCPANDVARFQHNAGLPVWRYQFGVAAPDAQGTVGHNAELKYVFDLPPAGVPPGTWPPVQEYWVHFAKTGNPNGSGLPNWPPLGRSANYLEFIPQGPRFGQGLRGAICRRIRGTASG
jgi:para-nitrobenzyl esterase